MSLIEMLPDLHSLSRVEKIQLIQVLARDLEGDQSNLLEEGKSYPIWSPHDAYGAAASMLEVLDEENRTS